LQQEKFINKKKKQTEENQKKNKFMSTILE